MSRVEVATYAKVANYDHFNYNYNEALHKQFLDWLDKTGNSPRIAANMLRWAVEDVECYIEKRLAVGLDFELEMQVAHLLEHQKPSDFLPKDTVVPTSVFKQGWEGLQVCHELRFTGYIAGDSGIGKSTILAEWKKQYPDTIFLTLDITKRSLGSVLKMIAETQGYGYWGERAVTLCLERLNEGLQDWPAPLIIDECQHLSFPALEGLRRIYDVTGISLVYVGQPGFFYEMKSRNRGLIFDQIVSRITIKRFLGKEIPEQDVQLVAESICPGLDKKCVRFLHRITLGEGKFRALRDTLKIAQRIGQVEDRKMTLDLLKGAYGLREI